MDENEKTTPEGVEETPVVEKEGMDAPMTDAPAEETPSEEEAM